MRSVRITFAALAIALVGAAAGGASARAAGCGCASAQIPRSSQPDWSPNGRRIAFVRRNGRQSDIWVMNRDGSGKRRLTPTEYPSEHSPDWSPDGRKIAFTSNSDGNDADRKSVV